MYIVILLMTYVSAIYEYNLSVRPDYDRDIAKKKATAIFYKFDIQHAVALRSIGFVTGLTKDDGVTYVDPTFPQPNMLFAASKEKCEGISECKNKNYHDSTLFFNQGSDYIPIYLRPECIGCGFCDSTKSNCSVDTDGDGVADFGHVSSLDYDKEDGNWYQKIMMTEEQSLYDEKEMISKLVCLDNDLYAEYEGEEIKNCVSSVDESGNLTGSCCTEDGNKKVLVSYKPVDPRWLNRVTNGIAMDFWRAIENRPFYTNLGIVNWDATKHRWIFRGRTGLYAAYYEANKAWKEQEKAKAEEDSSYIEKLIPRYMKKITEWELPSFFDEDFFVGIDGADMCKATGCIFRLNEF